MKYLFTLLMLSLSSLSGQMQMIEPPRDVVQEKVVMSSWLDNRAPGNITHLSMSIGDESGPLWELDRADDAEPIPKNTRTSLGVFDLNGPSGLYMKARFRMTLKWRTELANGTSIVHIDREVMLPVDCDGFGIVFNGSDVRILTSWRDLQRYAEETGL